MKFNVRYLVGKHHYRDKNIVAKNLKEAEEMLNEKRIKWVDIEMIDKTKGIEEY
jgi:hypothetical protein